MCRALLLLMLLSSGTLFGQVPQSPAVSQEARQGHLSGRVADPTDAVIPAATVTIHSVKGGEEKTTETDRIGRFQFQNLPFGQYTLTITRDGFAEYHGKFTLTASKESANVDARLKIATAVEQVDVDSRSDTLDPNNNPDGITLKQDQVDTLPDDPTLLSQELTALSGGLSPNIYVDGFSGGSIPPKSMIREIRINQNPYTAKNDTDPFAGMIEIFTKPGTQKLHGQFTIFGNDSALNAKNPFYPNQPAYHSYYWFGNLSGPLTKRSSYFVNGFQQVSDTNATIAAEILDPNLNQVAFNQAVPQKSEFFGLNPRIDLQLSKNDTLSLRYQISRSTSTNGGVGGFSLASLGSNSDGLTQGIQIINSQTIAAKILNETRFQYLRSRFSTNPYDTTDLSLVVQGAFSDGGNPGGHSQSNQDRYEFQDYVSLASHNHFLNFGVRLRSVRDASDSFANFNGQYTFPTLDAYQITEQILAANPGVDPTTLDPQIRAAGGGASQYSITQGKSSVTASMSDAALFYQDDWRWKPTFTLSYGLRYEVQTSISDHRDIAPRLGFAWNFGPKKSPYTLTAGNGLFYHRFPISSIMNAERQNGVNQQHYVVLDPDTFPDKPDVSTLTAQTSSSNYEINPHYRAQDVYVASINLGHAFFKNIRTSANYWYAAGFHGPLVRNINTPLPGTYDPTIPGSGVRPFGGTNNIFSYDSEGQFRYYRFMPAVSYFNSKGAFFSAQYQLVWFTVDDTGTDAGPVFAANPYNLSADKGRGTGQDTRNRIVINGSLPLPWHFNTSFFLTANSAPPFDIVLGQDRNGDSIFNDRPAFATDLTRPSVVTTKWGIFDTDPLPTQTIIPFNYGRAPGSFTTQLMIGRKFTFGPEQHRAPGAKGPLPRKFTLQLSGIFANLLNHPNLAPPSGTLGSPLFGRSLGISGQPRTIEIQASFSF